MVAITLPVATKSCRCDKKTWHKGEKLVVLFVINKQKEKKLKKNNIIGHILYEGALQLLLEDYS
jgi:hypothetical protein